MPQSQDLMGASMAWPLAAELGNDVTSINGAGTTAGAATPITSHFVLVNGASSQTGAILPSGATLGAQFYVTCPTATTAVVYCPVSGTMNGTTNAGLSLAQNKTAVFIRNSNTDWVSILTA